jgi:excisionase family DNA binding protein
LAQAAQLLKVHPKTLQEFARVGTVPACKVGRSWIFLESLLLDWLRAKSLARASVADLQENSECRSTDETTRRIGGSSCRPSREKRGLYSDLLGLPSAATRSKSKPDSSASVGSRTGSV